MLLESYGLAALLELGGMSPMTGASLLIATAYREPQLSREGGEMEGLPSNTKKWSEEMSLKNSQEQVKSLQVRISDQGSKGTLWLYLLQTA